MVPERKKLKVAVSQLEGRLSGKINKLRRQLVEMLASIEVNLDYPEYDFEEVTADNCALNIRSIYNELKNLIEGFHYGKILREGMEVAIIGKPNAGKSSLLNRLSGKTGR